MTAITEGELIQKLHDLGTDENGDITEEFLHFDAGTGIIEIWGWDEENYPGFSIVKVMVL